MARRARTLMDASYSRRYGEMYRTHWWWRARERNVLHEVRRFTRGGERAARILDIGCGDGYLWDHLEDIGHVEGIEPDENLIAADSRWRDRIEVADLLSGRPRPAHHDLVLMLDVLEHIAEERAALDRVVSLLRPGGHLVLTVPALPALWSEFDVLSGHHRRYTRKTLHRALRGAGLTVLELRYCYVWTVPPLLLRRALFRAKTADHSRFVTRPAAPFNAVLTRFSMAEHLLTRRVPAPLGSSLIAVATRAADDRTAR